MIRSLLPTIFIEGIIVVAYSVAARRQTGALLAASLIVNVCTQAALWMILGIFFRYYMIALLSAEVLIWAAESLLMHRLSGGQLTVTQASLLSLCMNLASFAAGWIMAV